MNVVYSKDALKFLAKAEKKTVNNIREAVKGLLHKPPEGDIKPMEGYKDGRYRLRVGKYRVIYRFDNDDGLQVLYIIDIGSRGDIYK